MGEALGDLRLERIVPGIAEGARALKVSELRERPQRLRNAISERETGVGNPALELLSSHLAQLGCQDGAVGSAGDIQAILRFQEVLGVDIKVREGVCPPPGAAIRNVGNVNGQVTEDFALDPDLPLDLARGPAAVLIEHCRRTGDGPQSREYTRD